MSDRITFHPVMEEDLQKMAEFQKELKEEAEKLKLKMSASCSFRDKWPQVSIFAYFFMMRSELSKVFRVLSKRYNFFYFVDLHSKIGDCFE